MAWKIFLLVLFTLAAVIDAGKVLFYIPFSSKSMKITYTPIMDELARKGHKVYAVIPFKDPKANYTIIHTDPDENLVKMIDKATEPVLTKEDASILGPMYGIVEGAIQLNDNAMKDPIMQKLLQDPSTKFDLVIVFPFLASEAGYFLAQKWDAPTAIYFSGQCHVPFVNSAIGQPLNTAFNPLPMLPYTPEMNLVQRTVNTFATFMFEHVFRNQFILRQVHALLDKHFPNEAKPDLLALEKNVSLVLSFAHPLIMDGWSPLLPNYVQLGMMNCRPGKAFAKGDPIGDYLEKSKNGVVFVSFGSVLKPSLITPKNREILVKVFKKFPQYDFLWKWDQDELPGKPDNVLLSKWLPQQDILAHPNLKAFISHTGQSSFQESLCHQKPVLAIPVTGDQPTNAREVERMGFGIAQPYATLEEKALYKALDEVLHNPVYAENAKKQGALLNDQINRPLDRAVWWIEHVMRHPKVYQGKSPMHRLNWFQYHLLDVYAVYLCIIFILYKIVRFFVSCCCLRKKEKQE